jgi:hypothetical protein
MSKGFYASTSCEALLNQQLQRGRGRTFQNILFFRLDKVSLTGSCICSRQKHFRFINKGFYASTSCEALLDQQLQ